jgi:thiol-disulfide isomerase/thioredoxin
MIKQLFSTILITILIFSCTEPAKEMVQIQGQVMNVKEKKVRFRTSDSTYTADLDSLGNFSIEMDIDEAQYVRFSHGPERSTFYLIPKSNMTFSIDSDQFDETISFEGENADASNLTLKMYLIEEQLPSPYRRSSDEPLDFMALLDSIYTAKNDFLMTYKGKVPEDFYNLEAGKIVYEKVSNAANYLSSRIYRGNTDPVPEAFFTYRDEIDFNREDLLDVSTYTSALSTEMSLDLNSDLDWNDPESRLTFFNKFIDVADSLIDSQLVLAAILEDHIGSYKSYVDINAVASKLDEYKSIFDTESYNDMKEVIAKISALAPGSEVPNFEFVSLEDEKVALSDFKGNLVYIDLWATWCGPCLREQPFMEKLIEEYEGKPISFLAISIDNSPEPWKKMVPERELSGTHVYAEDAWNSGIIKHFVVEGIPRYILLDPEGKIIDRNAPRPSGNISEVIAEELTKI